MLIKFYVGQNLQKLPLTLFFISVIMMLTKSLMRTVAFDIVIQRGMHLLRAFYGGKV